MTEAVNGALAELAGDGTLQEIIDSYIVGTDYKYVSPEDIDLSAGALTLAVDAAFPPYEYTAEDGEIAGLDIDVCRAVCDLLGVDLEVTVVDSDKLGTTVQFGKADLAMGRLAENESEAETS